MTSLSGVTPARLVQRRAAHARSQDVVASCRVRPLDVHCAGDVPAALRPYVRCPRTPRATHVEHHAIAIADGAAHMVAGRAILRRSRRSALGSPPRRGSVPARSGGRQRPTVRGRRRARRRARVPVVLHRPEAADRIASCAGRRTRRPCLWRDAQPPHQRRELVGRMTSPDESSPSEQVAKWSTQRRQGYALRRTSRCRYSLRQCGRRVVEVRLEPLGRRRNALMSPIPARPCGPTRAQARHLARKRSSSFMNVPSASASNAPSSSRTSPRSSISRLRLCGSTLRCAASGRVG